MQTQTTTFILTGVIKKLYYDDNVLFYPGGDDVKKYERHIKLKEIGI